MNGAGTGGTGAAGPVPAPVYVGDILPVRHDGLSKEVFAPMET